MANPPISSRLSVASGENTSPHAKQWKERTNGVQPLGVMGSRFKPTRVASSTTPSKAGGSETVSSDAQTQFGQACPSLSGQDRHFLGLLEDPSISDAEGQEAFDNYFF
jgi:hypothetical protein